MISASGMTHADVIALAISSATFVVVMVASVVISVYEERRRRRRARMVELPRSGTVADVLENDAAIAPGETHRVKVRKVGGVERVDVVEGSRFEAEAHAAALRLRSDVLEAFLTDAAIERIRRADEDRILGS